MNHGVDGAESLGRCVLQESSDQVNGIVVRLPENPVERVRLNLRELVLHVVGVHSTDLLPSRRSQNLDNLHELIYTRLAREQRLAEHQLCHNAASGPDVYGRANIRR